MRQVVTHDELAVGLDAGDQLGELQGHEPALGAVAARLLGHRKALQFKKGGVACIEVEALPLPAPGVQSPA